MNEALVSCKCLGGTLVFNMSEEVRLSLSYFVQGSINKKPYEYLNDASVISVISKNSSSLKSSPPTSKKQKGIIDDDIFERELKPFIRNSEPLDESCKKYFKNFFCDHLLSPDLRRWLWRERIGNPIRMNRTIFTTWCKRTSFLGICSDQEAVIKADLIRACSSLEENEDKVRIFSDLEKLISTFVVHDVNSGI